MRSRSLTILLVLGLLLALHGRARATTVHPFTLEELIYVSDRILTGEVVSTESRFVLDGTAIHTYVEVEVSEVLKGAAPQGNQVVWLLGGVVGDTAMVTDSNPSFVDGEQVLLFLEQDPHGYSVLGVFQGKYDLRLSKARGEWVAFRGPLVRSDLGPLTTPATITEDAVSWSVMKSTIEEQVRSNHVPQYVEIPGLLDHKRRAFRAHWGLPDEEVGR